MPAAVVVLVVWVTLVVVPCCVLLVVVVAAVAALVPAAVLVAAALVIELALDPAVDVSAAPVADAVDVLDVPAEVEATETAALPKLQLARSMLNAMNVASKRR